MRLPTRLILTEVGPRDGLQAENAFLPTEQKVTLINALSRTGLQRIEVTSFVHPKAVPQLADAEDVMATIDRQPNVTYSAMVPNARGASRAVASRIDEMVAFFSASETHNRKNVNMTVEESLQVLKDILRIGREGQVPLSTIISTAFGCPFEGAVPEERVLYLVGRIVELGIGQVTLADTTGMANPNQVYRLCSRVVRACPEVNLGLHFHNTRGAASANVLAGLEVGVSRFDGSIGGLGGCPFAPGATGNLATEDMAHMLEEMGINTGIDLAKLIDCAKLAERFVQRELPGQVMKAGVCGHLVGMVSREK
jgi:hydroxymethylglutaryl-CoA lyase